MCFVDPLLIYFLDLRGRFAYICRGSTDLKTMKPHIREIAQIQSGLYAKPDLHGNAVYLQVRHFDEFGQLHRILEPDLFVDEKMRKHLLRDGDILFMAKGSRNVAVVYRSLAGDAVASSSFIVIRLNVNLNAQILPEYLAWFINHPRTQEILKTHSKGSGIPSIALSGFAELEVYIPPLEKQKTILAIHHLRIKETRLIAEIDRLKEEYIQHQLFSGTQK